MSARPYAALGLIMVLGLAVASCVPEQGAEKQAADTDRTEAEPAQAVQAERVRLSIATDEGTLTPYTYVSGSGWLFLHMIYDGLLTLDENNEPQPLLATDVDLSDDGLTYTLPLRDDVTWHDGEPFTADDVVFSLEYAAENNHSRWTPAVEGVAAVEATDEHEVVITLDEPDAFFDIRPLADMPIFPRHVWENITDPEAAEVADAVGTGPYRLLEHVEDQRYRMEANPDYFLGEPNVEALDIVIIPEPATAFSALRANDIDAAFQSLEPQLVDQFKQQDDLAVSEGPGFRSELLQFNTEFPLLEDARVRQAIGYAIDVEELIEVVLLGHGTAGTQGFAHPDSPMAVDPIEHVHDPERAAELLDSAGYEEGPEGTRSVDGESVQLTLIADAADPVRVRSAELIRDMLDEIGIGVTVETMERQAVTDRVWPEFDVSAGRDFQMAMFGWSPPVMLDPSRVGSLVHSNPTRGSINIGGLQSPELDALVDEFATATDPDRQEELLQEIQEGIAQERPFVTLFYPDIIHAYRPDVYDGWVFQDGQGIIQKLSFIPQR